MRRADSKAPWLSLPTPQVLQLPRESVDLGHAVKEPIPGGTAPGALGASVDVATAVGLGLDAVNRALAAIYGPAGEWRDKR
jgi:hypothetical protein